MEAYYTFFLNEYFADYIVLNSWFKILDKTRYKGYDLFYTVEKTKENPNTIIENKYMEYRRIFTDFITYHEDLIDSLNKKIQTYDWDIYLFWAHIFSQYLLGFWLNKSKINCIIDNSDLKNGRRLYWTSLISRKPEIISWKSKIAVILKATIYQEEIRKQLLELNPNVEIWE